MRTKDKGSYIGGILVGLLCLGCVSSVPLRLFYPYGETSGDNVLSRRDDTSSTEIQLQTPIHFYDGFYTSTFANSNGHLSFDSELPGYQPTMVMPMGLNIKVIAAFMADIDTSIQGNVFYRESRERPLLERVEADIQAHFSQFPAFEPLGLFIATWDKVASYNGDSNVVNTFQIVIASDELNSFVIFNYLDEGIEWTQISGKLGGDRKDPPPQAGFDSGVGRLHLKLPYSGTNNVEMFARESNVNLPGVWMFHIGETKGGNVVGPDLNTGDVEIFEPEVSTQTCLGGSRQCHGNATCIDFDEGFCCECVPPYFGNGRNCVNPAISRRLNGKISGVINGVTMDKLDMHGFVVVKDGRAYTAISRIPDEISSQLMTLNTIGGIIGWMFAVMTGPQATNGYVLTGGVFNRTARIKYQSGGEVIITQRFFGQDIQDDIRLETYVNGTIPDIEATDKITVDDYKEEYRRVSPGVVRSFSDRTYRVNDVAAQYTWDQTITFQECMNDPSRFTTETMRLDVTRNFIVYAPADRVVRFAMSNKIGVLTGADPCREGASNCHENADCIPGGASYTCECRTGFNGNGRTCTDLDECAMGLNTCDINAICINTIGAFTCQCNTNAGFSGDGYTCRREVSLCGDRTCPANSHCVFNSQEARPMCECDSGFRGDGTTCTPISFACNEVDICHENAECIYNQAVEGYSCECVEGFSGDGLYCEDYRLDGRCSECDAVNGGCVYDTNYRVYRCQCNVGYTGDGKTCSQITDVSSACDDCHPNAQCVIDQLAGAYRCQCSPGFRGDGTRCEAYDCRDNDICDVNARCGQDVDGYYVCRCNAGYRGDGRRCEPAGCNVANNCDVNAECVADPRDTSRYMCRCNQGYSGNGEVCIRRVVPCNEVDNCSHYGECVYDPQSLDYRCRCHEGYEGDGITCRVRGLDCRRDNRICDPNASCVLNVDTFVCVCNQNYRGDGQSCLAMSEEMNYLLFSRGYSIHKVAYTQNGLDTDGSRVLYVPDELAIGVASDCVDQSFYWTDVSKGKISKANLDGLNKEVVASGFSSPEGIAVDWLSRNLYVTDSGLDVIAVVSMNGTNKKTIVSQDMVNPRAIVVDPQRGVMYWTDWYRDNPTIETANMDGSERQTFITTDLGLPNGLTIDYYTQQLCWGDAGMTRIECIRTDGIGRRIVTEDAPYPFDITFYGNTLYWSDWKINGVPNVNRDGGDQGEPLKLPVGGNGRLYGLAAVGEFCPRVNNACYRSNGGCRYFCLPTPNGGRTCACPDDIDEVTCKEIGTLRKKKK